MFVVLKSAAGEFSVSFKSVGLLKEVGSENASAIISSDENKLTVNVPKLRYPTAYVEIPVIIKNYGSISTIIKGIVTTRRMNIQ